MLSVSLNSWHWDKKEKIYTVIGLFLCIIDSQYPYLTLFYILNDFFLLDFILSFLPFYNKDLCQCVLIFEFS